MRCSFATVMIVIQKHMSYSGNRYVKYIGNKAYRMMRV